MATCEVCGNDYDKTFEVRHGGETHVFDSFECAIHALAPVCEHCGCRVIGHGVEAESRIFCCAHCASEAGLAGLPIAPERPPAGESRRWCTDVPVGGTHL